MSDYCSLPTGSLALRTFAMPANTNANGDIFGGWIMSQMDIAGGITAKEITKCATVTVAVESMKFFKPVKVGDIVSCYCNILKVGKTSLTLAVEVWIEPILRKEQEDCPRFKVTEAAFTYVAIDENGHKQPVYRN